MSRLCAEALQAGIEPEFATRLITTRELHAPSPDIEAWPWSIRIHVLGRFEVVVNGEVLRHTPARHSDAYSICSRHSCRSAPRG